MSDMPLWSNAIWLVTLLLTGNVVCMVHNFAPSVDRGKIAGSLADASKKAINKSLEAWLSAAHQTLKPGWNVLTLYKATIAAIDVIWANAQMRAGEGNPEVHVPEPEIFNGSKQQLENMVVTVIEFFPILLRESLARELPLARKIYAGRVQSIIRAQRPRALTRA